MLYAIIPIEKSAAKTNWTNLDDPKVLEKYKAELEKQGPFSKEDSTGKVINDIHKNRLLQTPDSVKAEYDKWLSEWDATNTPITIGPETFADALKVKEEDPTKVVRDNPGKTNGDPLSPYKMTARLIGERLNALVKLRKSALQEVEILTEYSSLINQRAKFLERFFGPEEMKRRSRHYTDLNNFYSSYVLLEIEKRGKDAIQKLIDAFTQINEKGLAEYDSQNFDHAAKSGKKFIDTLKNFLKYPEMNNKKSSVEDAYRYLYSSILSGDGQAIISKSNSRLRKILSNKLTPIQKLNIRLDNWIRERSCK